MKKGRASSELCVFVSLWAAPFLEEAGYKGILPCFFGGLLLLLFWVISKA